MEKGSFQKSRFSRDSREFRDSRVSGVADFMVLPILEFLESPQTVEKKGDSDHFLRDSREFRDFRDSRAFSTEKTPFVMTPSSAPESKGEGEHSLPKASLKAKVWPPKSLGNITLQASFFRSGPGKPNQRKVSS